MWNRTRIRNRLPIVCLLLTLWTKVSQSTGYFELQLISVENVIGELADGECCDGPRSPQDLRCSLDECDTYLRVCLKEYQQKVTTTGACTFGAGSTQVLGGNMFSLETTKNNANKINEAGKVVIPFQFAWLLIAVHYSSARCHNKLVGVTGRGVVAVLTQETKMQCAVGCVIWPANERGLGVLACL
ncbi:PREDICTED: protein jagged-1b-like [Cyprinodon variegatus]|uniref:protein jagged-1b-like n=1 Tax=Cyprinodon variegatus TaxID=28743 RepID=UPI000742AEA6|nr:PREDICTED: protein jagged-1b-like [Cyprinodon variegatus]